MAFPPATAAPVAAVAAVAVAVARIIIMARRLLPLLLLILLRILLLLILQLLLRRRRRRRRRLRLLVMPPLRSRLLCLGVGCIFWRGCSGWCVGWPRTGTLRCGAPWGHRSTPSRRIGPPTSSSNTSENPSSTSSAPMSMRDLSCLDPPPPPRQAWAWPWPSREARRLRWPQRRPWWASCTPR